MNKIIYASIYTAAALLCALGAMLVTLWLLGLLKYATFFDSWVDAAAFLAFITTCLFIGGLRSFREQKPLIAEIRKTGLVFIILMTFIGLMSISSLSNARTRLECEILKLNSNLCETERLMKENAARFAAEIDDVRNSREHTEKQ